MQSWKMQEAKGQLSESHDARFRREVQRGLDEANAGKLISAEEVEAEAAAWRAELKRKLADNES